MPSNNEFMEAAKKSFHCVNAEAIEFYLSVIHFNDTYKRYSNSLPQTHSMNTSCVFYKYNLIFETS